MEKKIKIQKGFIQIPILIGIIISLVVAGGIGAGLILHKQGKQASITANISEVFPETKESRPIDSNKELEPQDSQIEKKREVTQESNAEAEKEIEELKKIIKNQKAQIDELLSRSPEIKEIVKEVPVEKIVYKEICSCPQTQSETSNEQFITYSGSEFGGKIHDYFPVITSFSAEPSPEIYLKAGDEIHLNVVASDPQDRQILYSWWSYTVGGGGLSKVYNGWTVNNEIRYKVTSDDAKISGENFRVGVQIKSEKEHYRTGTHGYDDEIYIDYTFSF